ncbi:uncharacterized protein L969DRAFT_96819 [Mixia osmundae IAM 14324]|uniref:WW domain-containing protein n=1 Tax=Mixia osmundae (strain CBS 9802 / IAM 14324 / JCM 22182 / KY 12970) TaxID=764103 RepID=G7E266_MIXOS|nr:uncharacterized protein L969DRAFT_96819 [Mixia osmundae IAM 14324]KEI36798.1 hypothetical protein L969DRAFT_96819 [Mixia osmundae IAM 14324]GAA96926.1 hypothetical protein E5Q_03600 [Mixia osmundae IAM 14324]
MFPQPRVDTGPLSSPAPHPETSMAQRPLPEGWIAEYDETYQAYYYVDTLQTPPTITWSDPREDGSLYAQHSPAGRTAPLQPVTLTGHAQDQASAAPNDAQRGFFSTAIAGLSQPHQGSNQTMSQMAQTPAYSSVPPAGQSGGGAAAEYYASAPSQPSPYPQQAHSYPHQTQQQDKGLGSNVLLGVGGAAAGAMLMSMMGKKKHHGHQHHGFGRPSGPPPHHGGGGLFGGGQGMFGGNQGMFSGGQSLFGGGGGGGGYNQGGYGQHHQHHHQSHHGSHGGGHHGHHHHQGGFF